MRFLTASNIRVCVQPGSHAGRATPRPYTDEYKWSGVPVVGPLAWIDIRMQGTEDQFLCQVVDESYRHDDRREYQEKA